MKKCAPGWKAGNAGRLARRLVAVCNRRFEDNCGVDRDRDIDTANRIARAIYDAVQSLRTMPYRGRYGRLENTRELVVARLPYIVVYQVFEERVVILNILHGAQRWP